MRRRFHEANIVGVPCKRAQHCFAMLRQSQNNRNVGTCWPKVWPVSNCTQQVPTSANIAVVPCKRTQQVTTLLGPTMLGLLANNVASTFAWAFTCVEKWKLEGWIKLTHQSFFNLKSEASKQSYETFSTCCALWTHLLTLIGWRYHI